MKRPKDRPSQQLSSLAANILDPVLRRRSGMMMDLFAAWPEIAGPHYASLTRPERLKWPRKSNQDDPFKPAKLLLNCDPSIALFLQHDQTEIIERLNLFFGFHAVDRIQIIQKPVKAAQTAQKPVTPLSKQARERLDRLLKNIESEELREKLEQLGKGVFRQSSADNE